ncbi:uridine kinase family protein [Streptococcus sp. S784/96/1]|uniref:uridine kinase family protein n=1 Tax=Streptococcus sp. S784/96/1 TaxID=2653499 RepID=UPI0013871735|nr:phosphoribulokinase [Streptococcus sp. S784/96/1]
MTKIELLDYLHNYLSDGQRHTVRIFGHGGAGKSTFAKELLEILPSDKVNLLETDPYIINGELRQLVSSKDFPNQKVTASMPVSHELNSLKRDITALQMGMDILTIDEPWTPSRILKGSKPILIIEGMSAGFLNEALFDLSIALVTDEETELNRRLERDTKVRGRHADFVLQTHLARRQQYETYYKSYENSADIIISQINNQIITTFKN